MSKSDVDKDVEKFFNQYIIVNGIDGIEPEDIGLVFTLYICRYLEYADKKFDITLN